MDRVQITGIYTWTATQNWLYGCPFSNEISRITIFLTQSFIVYLIRIQLVLPSINTEKEINGENVNFEVFPFLCLKPILLSFFLHFKDNDLANIEVRDKLKPRHPRRQFDIKIVIAPFGASVESHLYSGHWSSYAFTSFQKSSLDQHPKSSL